MAYFCRVKELVRHIEVLLLEHDCVIIPQIGGFVTCNVPARYIEEEHLFLPPYRTVGFNEQLKADDGLLLVRSFAKTYQISDAEARRMLGIRIRELQQELWENGFCDMGSIGVLTMDEQNNIRFSPCQAGTVCPDYFGLDSLLFPVLNEEVPKNNTPSRTLGQPKEDKDKEITIRLKKTWLNNIAAVAAVVIMFFLFSPNAGNTGVSSCEQAEFASLMVMQPSVKTTHGPAVKQEPVREITEKPHAPVAKTTTPAVVVNEQPSVKETAEEFSGYCVVVASAITEKNADAYVEKLHKEGYKEAKVYKNGKMVRVVFPGFKTEEDAHARMNELSDLSEEFAHAWVYKIE